MEKLYIYKNYILVGLFILILSVAFYYGKQVERTKTELNVLNSRINAKNKAIDSLLRYTNEKELLINRQKDKLSLLENNIVFLKSKNNQITKKYEALHNRYNHLSNDDKWIYFRSAIN